MATVKKGHLARAKGQFDWARHLRWGKRLFWKAERQAASKLAKREASNA
jgi:hypothetical protein